MPTFQFFKNKTKIAEMTGANKEKLEALIKEHASSEGGSSSSSSSIAGGYVGFFLPFFFLLCLLL